MPNKRRTKCRMRQSEPDCSDMTRPRRRMLRLEPRVARVPMLWAGRFQRFEKGVPRRMCRIRWLAPGCKRSETRLRLAYQTHSSEDNSDDKEDQRERDVKLRPDVAYLNATQNVGNRRRPIQFREVNMPGCIIAYQFRPSQTGVTG